ncbi:unnamed protein product [Urochloa decumbens]|uniref:Rx N-terminal domain-containing protein n=1 Tax=Urochloa decumbens TaxID=240449 RepID=A0ABC9ECW0_9POAL
MADTTHGAIDRLLGVLATAIGDEAQLLGGLPGNMQFIKDEMDSMNGFLMHLTKTEKEHDDQIRAWMKQVSEIACVAEDCVERYVRDIAPYDGGGGGGGGGILATVGTVAYFLCHPKKYMLRRRLAKQILELKVRVNDVGERRNRYGVEVPRGSADVEKAEDDGPTQEQKMEFLRELELAEQAGNDSDFIISKAIGHLPDHIRSGATTVVRDTWKKCSSSSPHGTTAFRCIKMLLCALYVYPYKTIDDSLELRKLKGKLDVYSYNFLLSLGLELPKLKRKLGERGGGAEEIERQVMVFCYSLLSTNQKSCLHYLTCFLNETAISRTSLVRRWVAEGLVRKERGTVSLEEAGERYFNELLFRGFIRPARVGDSGTVKSCGPLDGPIREFITSISTTENFVDELPVHFGRQLQIRRIVSNKRPPTRQAAPARWSCSCSGTSKDDGAVPNPMDELVNFLRELPAMYRLNVLDLGGCKGVKPGHVETICTVAWLKYLCLRNTDVTRLPPRHMVKLKLLETLDIRETPCLRTSDVKKMYLHSLKHMLAGQLTLTGGAGEDDDPAASTRRDVSLVTVKLPARIGEMRSMETLSHVQVSDTTDLGGVAKLRQLKKLGVVIRHANDRAAQAQAQQLRSVMYALAESLRSLSIWVTRGGVLDISSIVLLDHEGTSSLLMLENLHINGRTTGSGLPSWVEKAGKLANISLRDTEMNAGETLRRLANVQSLRCLKLSRRSFSFVERALIFGHDDVRFGALRFLVIDGDTITNVAFDTADAAPKLEKIVWSISMVHAGERRIISGIDHLKNLTEIELRGNFDHNKLLQAIGQTTADPPNTKYRCWYVYRPEDSKEKTTVVVNKANTDATLSLPEDVVMINQEQ